MGQITIRLPFPVSINEMYVNRAGPGRSRNPSAAFKAWTTEAGLLLNTQRPPRIGYRVTIHIDLDDRRQGDADSRIKCVLDILVKHGILVDDRKKFVKRTSIGWEPVEGCVVRIERATDDDSSSTHQTGVAEENH
jgi:Holliday junction resolvase RusA-like endonuclease